MPEHMNSKVIDIIQENPDQRCIDLAVDELRNGGILCYPTDTVYGLFSPTCTFRSQIKI